MRKAFMLFVLINLFVLYVIGQAPQAFKYQAIVRNNHGDPLVDQKVSIKVLLIQGDLDGEAVYSEYHYATTNSFGLINIQIGQGDYPSSWISDIDWSTGNYFIRLEMDEQGGDNYKAMGQSQLLSVPYALYAERSGSGSREDDLDWGKRMNDKLDLFTGTGGSFPDGNVGIGTFIPKAKLEVAYQYGFGSSFMRVNNTPGGNSIFMMRRARGTIGLKTAAQNGDFIGQIAFEGYDGTNFKRAAVISSLIDGPVSSGIVSASLIFHTRDTLGVMGRKMRIHSNGLVDVLGYFQVEDGTSINEFSTDTTLADNSDDAVPTEKAIKTYVDNQISSLDSLSDGMIWIGDVNGLSQEHTMSGDVTITNAGVTTIGTGKVINNMLAGGITDNKLNTLTTAGKVANSATTATTANTINTIVLRDGSGNFLAGTITADLVGNVTGDLTGNVTGNVSGNAGTVTDISSHSVTELSDVSSAGSGQIITTAERTLLTATPGTVAASKAVIVDASRNIQNFNNLQADGTITSGSSIVIDGTGGTLGLITESHGKISFDDEILITTGNVGIGTTDPQTTLDVNGNMQLLTGTSINEFSTDTTLAGNSDDAVPTEKAIKTYVDNAVQFSDSLSDDMIWIGDANGLSQEHTISGDVTITNAGVTAIGGGKVTNVMLAGGITDNKLNTITTAGKVSNSATTATTTNTINTIVLRDGSGNFLAGTITADLVGNVTGHVTGDLTGNVTGNVSGNAGTVTDISSHSVTELNDISSAGSGQIITTAERTLLTATPGTVAASKAVIVDASRNIQNFNNLQADGTITSGSSIVIDGTGGTLGLITESHGKISFDDEILVTTGNVGIGTTDPQTTLDVYGNMQLLTGTSINEFSTDTTLAGNSDDAVPTEKAIKTYIDNAVSISDTLSNGMIWIGDANDLSQEHTMSGDVTITNAGVTAIGGGKVTNVMLAGSITDNKFNTITTAGKVANSATTATTTNTINTIVLRDGSGNFLAGTITADLVGNVTGHVTGDLTGNVTGNVSGNAGTVTDISSHSVTELNDISSAGSGQIITTAERTLLTATPGTVAASKAVIVDASRNIQNFNNLQADGTITSGSSIIIDGTGGTLGLITESHGKISFDNEILVTTGNVGIGETDPSATLDVVGTLQYIDGTQGAGKVLVSDANGNASWATAPSSSAFSTSSNVTSNSPGDLTTDDFVFGSNSLDHDANSSHYSRFFFDKSSGAFRAGHVSNTNWDVGNRGNYSVAFGENTVASGTLATAMGIASVASGNWSTAMGSNTVASGMTSTAMGNNTKASGMTSLAIGNDTEASGISSFAMGNTTKAIGDFSTVMGVNTQASGEGAVAMGEATSAGGDRSTAMGYKTKTQSQYSFAIGRFNVGGGTHNSWVLTDPLFEIGIGADDANRANAITVIKGGNTGIGPTAPKSKLHVSGGIQFADDNDAASADKAGTIRYREDSNNSYFEICMKTGASTYAWVVIKQNTW